MATQFGSKGEGYFDLGENSFESDQAGVEQMEEAGFSGAEKVGGTTGEIKENVERLGLEKPINLDNIDVGENVPKEVVEHILKYNFEVQNPKFIKCVDGRTPEDLIKGIYMPGGTDGLLIVIFKILTDYNIDLDPEKVRNILVELVGGEENYYYHTDDHSCDISGACGCGHANLVLNDDSHKADLAPKYARFLEEKRLENKNKMEVLKGDHNEQGVILVDLQDISIVPRGADTSFFVYNQKNVQKLLKGFVEKINNAKDLKYTDFKGDLKSLYIDLNRALKELDEEALSTFNILGGEAPHYRLNLDKNTGKITIISDGKVKDVVKNYYLGE